MIRPAGRPLSVPFLALWLLYAHGVALHSQQGDDSNLQVTTLERMGTEGWWPTMSSLPLEAFAGSDACIHCHADEARQPSTAMQRAASRPGEDARLKGTCSSTLPAGGLHYALSASGAGLDYSVSDGHRTLSHKLDWVMGAGDLALTFLYQSGGHWYQSRASFYLDQSKLDITTGLEQYAKSGLNAALGQELTPDEARRCFNCHSVHAVTSSGFNPARAEAGLGCEACHGPGLKHVASMTAAGLPGKGGTGNTLGAAAGIFNPAKLAPADLIDFCGSCHRASADVAFSSNQTGSTAVVRFQPYRLQESACWRATRDARLTCVACHDPHRPLDRDAATYDKQCQQCHAASVSIAKNAAAGKVCPKAADRCVSCHMPKVAVASMHGAFTDHFIRIVKPGEEFPR